MTKEFGRCAFENVYSSIAHNSAEFGRRFGMLEHEAIQLCKDLQVLKEFG